MLTLLRENKQFYILLLTWLVVGVYGGPVVFAFAPLTLFLLKKKDLNVELFIGFWFILILSDNLEGPLRFAKNLKNIYIVLLFVFFIFNYRSFLPHNKLIRYFIPFFIIAVISMMFSTNIIVSFQKTLSYFILYLTVPNYIDKLYRDKGAYFFRQLIFFGLVIVAVGIILRYLAPEAVFIDARFRGVLGNPNGLGLFILLYFLLFRTVLYFFPRLFSVLEKRIIYVAIFLTVIWSGSRNAAVSIGLFMLFERFYRYSPFIGFIAFLVVLYLSELITTNYIAIIKALGLTEFFRLETLESGSGRYIAWEFAWKKIQDFYFLGRGFANDELTMRPNYEMLMRMGHHGGVHNSYLSFWMDTGLIGVICYFGAFFIVFFKAAKNSKIAFPVMYTIMFSIIFESWLVGSLNPFTIVFLMILTLLTTTQYKEAKDKVESEEKEPPPAPVAQIAQ